MYRMEGIFHPHPLPSQGQALTFPHRGGRDFWREGIYEIVSNHYNQQHLNPIYPVHPLRKQGQALLAPHGGRR